jgi:hypothetical protein
LFKKALAISLEVEMSTVIDEYLNRIKDNLNLESEDKNEVISELATHIEDEVQELQKGGLRYEDAVNTCLRFLGSAKAVAQQIYEAHSQGSWQQALIIRPGFCPELVAGDGLGAGLADRNISYNGLRLVARKIDLVVPLDRLFSAACYRSRTDAALFASRSILDRNIDICRPGALVNGADCRPYY